MLMGPLAQVGLALATSIGAWINFGLVVLFAARRGLLAVSPRLARSIIKLVVAGLVLAAVTWTTERPLLDLFRGWHRFGLEAGTGSLAAIGALAYGGTLAVLFGREGLEAFRRKRKLPPPQAA
jgi:putative peptidoglycan lipid II flippase